MTIQQASFGCHGAVTLLDLFHALKTDDVVVLAPFLELCVGGPHADSCGHSRDEHLPFFGHFDERVGERQHHDGEVGGRRLTETALERKC